MAASLITVPLTIKYLGNERFGLWMTISSLLVMAGFADFGLGNGLLNVIANAHGKDDARGIQGAISSALVALSVIGGFFLLIFLATYHAVSWADLFRVASAQARSEAGPALLVFGICFSLNLPVGVVQRAQIGLQQGFIANMWQLAGSLAGLLALLLCIGLHAGLPWLILAIAGAPVAAGMLNGFIYFRVNRPDLLPRPSLVSRPTIKRITSIGAQFFMLQLVVAMAYAADNFVVARTLGAASVPEYAIPQRMFAVITMLIATLISPLWPAYGEAISRGDTAWVRKFFIKSLLFVSSAAAIASFVLLLMSHRVIDWWVGPKIHPPLLLLIGLAVWTTMESCGSALSVFMNGAGLVRFQIALSGLFGVCCLAAKVYLTRRFGIVGLPWATIVTWGLITLLPSLAYLNRRMRKI